MGKIFGGRITACVVLAFVACSVLQAQERLEPRALALIIDQKLEERWQGIEAAPGASDAEFLRRVYLDLAGRIPRVREVRDFLEDPSSDRRARIVEQLLASPIRRTL